MNQEERKVLAGGTGRKIRDVHTIGFPINGALVESHDVLSESSRFVREDVLDLSQLFIEGGGTGLCWRIIQRVIHFTVPVNVEAVAQAYNLYTGEKGREDDGQFIRLGNRIFYFQL